MAEAMRHRWRPLGNNLRGTALTSDQEALTYHTCMLLSYSEKQSLQQPVMEMHRLREKTRSLLPLYPHRCPSDKGSKKQVQAENANAPRKSSDSETDRLQDIQEEPRRRIGPSHVKELAKFFMPTSDEEENSRVNNRTRRKKLF